MRIITGCARGAKLETLPGLVTRPTAERIKEAVFSSIHFDLPQTRFLDLFSGSGQIGLEAISRGAALSVFVDNNVEAIKIIKNNAQHTKLFDRCRICNCTYIEYLRSAAGREKFDFIYLDPPFGAHMLTDVLRNLARANILAPTGKIICESEQSVLLEPQDPLLSVFRIEKVSHYGRMYLFYLSKQEDV